MGVKMVGASVNRMEDPRLLRGEAAYIDDLRFPGLLHMAVLVLDAPSDTPPGS